jgi:hypothetical protein
MSVPVHLVTSQPDTPLTQSLYTPNRLAVHYLFSVVLHDDILSVTCSVYCVFCGSNWRTFCDKVMCVVAVVTCSTLLLFLDLL